MKVKKKNMKMREKNIFVINSLLIISIIILLNSCNNTRTTMVWKCYDYYEDPNFLEEKALAYVRFDNKSKDTSIFVKGLSYCSYDYKKVIGEEVFQGYFMITNGKDSLILDDGCGESIVLIAPMSYVEIPLFFKEIKKNIQGELFYNTIDSILTNGQMIYVAPNNKLNEIKSWNKYKKVYSSNVKKGKQHNCCYDNNRTKSKEYIEWEKELELEVEIK